MPGGGGMNGGMNGGGIMPGGGMGGGTGGGGTDVFGTDPPGNIVSKMHNHDIKRHSENVSVENIIDALNELATGNEAKRTIN